MAKKYISAAMLPLETISEYMEKVAGFRKSNQASDDTLHVAGVNSEVIAKAATDEATGKLIKDRDTVKNALELGGIKADAYITKEGAGTLLTDTYEVGTISADEIKNLRDELYQIKSELAKSGLIKDTECYNGFIDAFKVGKEKYISNVITYLINSDSRVSIPDITVQDPSDFMVGEFIVIQSNNKMQIAKIDDIQSDRIIFTSNIQGPLNQGDAIFKSYGTYNDGMFVFGKEKEVSVSPKERYIILNDDAQPLLLTKKYTPNSGYAAQINIPSTARGAIKKVGVQAKVNGFPGGLRCYVIDNESGKGDLYNMTTIDEIKDSGKIIAESNLLYPSQATQAFNELYFEFNKVVNLEKSTYTFLFVQIDADMNNYWELKGLRGQTDIDLQTNSKLYSFSEGTPFLKEDGDLYLIVVTSEVLLNQIEYSQQGLYSANVKLTDITEATRVRVELKVNREGRFKVIDTPNTLVPGPNRPVNLYNEDNKAYALSMFNTGEKIAIGNQIATVGNSRTNNTSFNLVEDTYAPAGSSVYRIGYKVQAKATKKAFTGNHLNPIVVEDSVLIDLPLIGIIPGKESGKQGISSDRLIFEGEFKVNDTGYKLEKFNEVEAQVYWENKSATIMDLMNNNELAGKILDITISTDKAYNKK